MIDEGRADRLGQLQDELEERIARLAEEEPGSDATSYRRWEGDATSGHSTGASHGEALVYLFELRMERGPIPEDEAFTLLDGWARDRGIETT
jgi:poly(A) polymerase